MTLPALILGILLSTAYGTGFHVFRGGDLKSLLLYIILSWIGFWVGHLLGDWFGLTLLSVGPLHAGMATIGSLLFLFVGRWLILPRKGEPE